MASIMQTFHNNLAFFYPIGSPCLFDENKTWSELCHLSFNNSDTSRDIIQKKFNCSKKIAGMIVDFPLLNVLPGSSSYNLTSEISHKVGTREDITSLPYRVVHCMELTINDMGRGTLKIIEPWYQRLLDVKRTDDETRLKVLREIHDEWFRWTLFQ